MEKPLLTPCGQAIRVDALPNAAVTRLWQSHGMGVIPTPTLVETVTHGYMRPRRHTHSSGEIFICMQLIENKDDRKKAFSARPYLLPSALVREATAEPIPELE